LTIISASDAVPEQEQKFCCSEATETARKPDAIIRAALNLAPPAATYLPAATSKEGVAVWVFGI
jgi:hypothetical protein